MKKINEYIIEKLKIDKDTKIEYKQSINDISKESICGIFRMYQGNNAGPHLIPDIIKIDDISKENKTVKFTYLTNKFGKKGIQETIKISPIPDKNFEFRGISSFQNSSKPCTILNKDEMIKYLKKVIDNGDNLLNWFDVTYKVFPAGTKPDIKVEYLIPRYPIGYTRNPNAKYKKGDFNILIDKEIIELINQLDK